MKSFRVIAFCILLGLSTSAGCGQSAKDVLTEWAQSSADPPRGTEITLKRTICFGECPIYSVRVNADGQIQFDGQEYISHIGRSTGQITTAQVRQLLQQFAAIDFFGLRDRYVAMGDCPAYATDYPSVIISLHFASETKTVELYLGCTGSPEVKAIAQLGQQIDTTINSQQWIK